MSIKLVLLNLKTSNVKPISRKQPLGFQHLHTPGFSLPGPPSARTLHPAFQIPNGGVHHSNDPWALKGVRRGEIQLQVLCGSRWQGPSLATQGVPQMEGDRLGGTWTQRRRGKRPAREGLGLSLGWEPLQEQNHTAEPRSFLMSHSKSESLWIDLYVKLKLPICCLEIFDLANVNFSQ